MKSLRTKMTIMIVSVVLGSSVLLSFISYQRAKESLVAQLENNCYVEAQKYALELTSWINTNATIIDTMAAEIAVNDISSKGYTQFHNYLQHSNELLNKNGYVYDVYFTYPDNYMVCASDFVSDGTVDFVHEREWYTKSALTGELYYSTPYLDSDTQQLVITISKAVYKDDQLLGVLAADIFLDVLTDKIEEAELGDNSYAFLVDQHMRMIANRYEEYDYDNLPLYVTDVPNSPYVKVVEAIESGSEDMVFIKDIDGCTRGIVYSQMPNTGWYVCIATDKGELEEGVISLLIGFIIATVFAIAIGVFMSVILARVLDQLNKQEQEYKQKVLRLEKQAADDASAAKSRFLADMSHEIRTPINAILGMNEMILRESENEDILGYSQNIKQSGNNLLQLINGILDFSKIEDGKMEIVPVRYKVAPQIAYYSFSVSERALSKHLELDFDIDENIPSELFGDDTRINQVVINLLTNAVKYTEKGSVTLSIKCKERKDDEVLLHFEIKDTGIGIKESDMEKLFVSFERLDVVRNKNIEGTGLGMTITTKLLELMNSSLSVESTYGMGSTFSFDLWQKVENEEPLGDYKKSIAGTQKGASYKESFRAPKAKILVVDDTKMNVLVVVNLLKKTGIKIDSALNGPDSIALADENEYDLILMDQRMPGMDGTEAMRRIKKLESAKNAKTPFICLTADVIRGARERYMEIGFDDYLTKPVEGAQLEKMVKDYLPKDKVEEVEPEEKAGSKKESESEDPLIAALERAGIDVKEGLRFSGNDMDMYKSIISAYASEKTDKANKLEEFFDAKDWKNYEIFIHSVKSTSKTIGAMKIFELAAESENAAKNGDEEIIVKNHKTVMKLYDELVGIIKIHTEAAETKEADILEFLPE